MLKRFGENILSFYCHPSFQEDIKGDLEEYYISNLEAKGGRLANRKYLIDVLLLFRISLLRDNWISQKSNNIIMVRNNIKVAYRSMMRHKFYSMLNLAGLAISMAACVFIAIYVQDETSYDKHFQNSDKIFRVAAHLAFADNVFNLPATPDPMAKSLKSDFPEVIEAGRTKGNVTEIISVNNEYFQQSGITWADQEFFNIFKFPVIRGNIEHFLDEPNTVVLEETTALKLFGNEDPIGKVIRYSDVLDLKVTGIIQDIPENTHFEYEMFISMLNRPDASRNVWLSNNFITYIELTIAQADELVTGKFPDFVLKYFGAQVKQFTGTDISEEISEGRMTFDYYLQPIESIHLHSNLDFELDASGSIQYIYMFSIIGFFILLIACINFMNMATARASVRAKEVGVRKVLGSLRKQLIGQFLTESLLNSVIAFTMAIVIVFLLLPGFNQLTDKTLTNPLFGAGGLWPYLTLAAILVGLAAGIYPAFVLSSFRPVKVLKGEMNQGKSANWMRNTLVVIQFSTSIFLIIGSMFVYSQLNYLQNKELGFNKDQILLINETHLLGDQISVFKEELLRSSYIEHVSITGYVPASGRNSDFPLLAEEASSPDEAVSVQMWDVDYDYGKTFEIELVAGRFFSKDIVSDSSGIIINETAARRFGYTDPVGRQIKTLGGAIDNRSQSRLIIGVMKDFHFRSMTEEILPHALLLDYNDGRVNVRFSPESAKEVLEIAEATWTKFGNGRPFSYTFLDQLFADTFQEQQKVKTIFTVFAVLAISIACLGLFGLAAYVTEQRKKEIGIRKVLGASTVTLLNLLFNNFTKLIIISAALAIPAAWWYMDGWLSDFPFRISMNPLIFILGAAGTLLLALLTVGYQSMKAAKRNPIDNLRYE
jgi:putative ABC transport system permease protein